MNSFRQPPLERFQEKWTPVFRRKRDKLRNLEPVAASMNRQLAAIGSIS
jgi:hypothetical protein